MRGPGDRVPATRGTPMACLLALLVAASACGDPASTRLRDGDLVFHTSLSDQSLAIRKATHSRYSHMGIVLFRDGEPMVFEAVDTVRYTPLDEWVARGEGRHYVVKRLRDADRVLTPGAVAKLRQAAGEFEGRPYDPAFGWSDSRIYCSELAWKIYDRALGVRIGRLQKLRELDLSDPVVQAKLRARYGTHVPMDETVISPGEMFSAEGLALVDSR